MYLLVKNIFVLLKFVNLDTEELRLFAQILLSTFCKSQSWLGLGLLHLTIL